MVHKLSVVEEAEERHSARHEIHSLVAADHRKDKRKCDCKEQIRVCHLYREHCDNRKREGRKEQQLLFVAVLEVKRDNVRFEHQEEDEVEDVDALLRGFAVHTHHAVEVERILDKVVDVGHLSHHQFETVESVARCDLMNRARNGKRVGKHEACGQTEHDFRSVGRKFLLVVVIFDVHIHKVRNDDGRNCHRSQIEHCGKSHHKVS